jgi:hypothetical protein
LGTAMVRTNKYGDMMGMYICIYTHTHIYMGMNINISKMNNRLDRSGFNHQPWMFGVTKIHLVNHQRWGQTSW